MLVSVIIPAYNAEKFLAEAIESCLAQTYRHLEILVVDDGSTDRTREVAERYPQVRYIYQENQGQGPAAPRNTGIEQSRGEFLQFLDADDVLLPRKIESAVAVLERQAEVGVVYTDYETRSHDLSQVVEVPNRPQLAVANILYDFIGTGACFPPHCALVRREVIEELGGFDTRTYGTEDWLFWTRLAVYGVQFHAIDKVLVWYRDTSQSISKNKLRMAINRLKAVEILHEETPLPPEIDLNRLLAGRHHVVAMRYWEQGQREAARRHFETALDLNPNWSDDILLMFSYFMSAAVAEKIISAAQRLKPPLQGVMGFVRRIRGNTTPV